ncbi:DUF502 domain-containing protein [Planctomycetota bacterium]
MSIGSRLKSYFLRGLAVLLPTLLTIWAFVWGYGFIQDKLGKHLNDGLVKLIMLIQGDQPSISETDLNEIFVEGAGSVVGFVVALAVVFIVGALLASVVGKSLWRVIERFIMNTPFLKQVYPYVKQITDFMFAQEEQKSFFSRVVAVEYPRKGIWSIGFVTGPGLKNVSDKVKKEILSVLIPTSPTPFTGFVIMVPKKETIEMDMTIEQALRFMVSGGVISPDADQKRDLPPETETKLLEQKNVENKDAQKTD